jgi:hypothetical protein
MKKYPRTFHISFSAEKHSDDKTINPIYEKKILQSEVVITVKMDGGNCCIKPNEGIFARTHAQETSCPSFNFIKNKHYYSKLHILNNNYWYFGENMFAIHSIEYNELEDFFYLFNIYDIVEKRWLSWDEMEKEAKRCEFNIVPVIFKGIITFKELEKIIKENINSSFLGGEAEGFVIRNINSFSESDFSKNIMKYVRNGHVQTDEHWSKNWKQHKLKTN